jgi:S-layer homology domain
MTLLRRLGLSLVFALLPCIAQAAPCSGFSDVDSASGFCPNVDWLRNRGVTLGCTATTYCPDEPVTRLQMAAFMNRLGTAFTPMILYANASGPVTFTNSIGYICMTADVPVFDFRRFASAISTVTFVAFGPASYMESRPVISSDAGAT